MSYDHLTPAAAEIVERSPEERLQWLKVQHWIPYTRAVKCLERLIQLIEHPKRKRMPNMLICGATNNGKSTVIGHFMKRFPRSLRADGSGQIIPVLWVDTPDGPYVRALLAAILRTLNLGGFASRPSIVMENMVLETLVKTETRMLIFDDIHNILDGRADQTRQFLNLLRYLNNVLMIPIVAVGTRGALDVMQRDSQTANRFRPFFLPKWSVDDEKDEGEAEDAFRLLDSFEAVLPLEEPSELSSPAMAKAILKQSDGLIGEIWTVLIMMTEAAIRNGDKRLLPTHLVDIDYRAPSADRYAEMARKEGVFDRLG